MSGNLFIPKSQVKLTGPQLSSVGCLPGSWSGVRMALCCPVRWWGEGRRAWIIRVQQEENKAGVCAGLGVRAALSELGAEGE